MSAARHTLLTALVLVNLAFVEITEGADWAWLAPLLLLTLGSPFLRRLRDYRLYRLVWNVAVVGVFAQLVHHTTSSGAEHLLEDGLLLAALCQVHLLNNLGPDQKPDLLLFNSFLIPVVTSFLVIDLSFCLVFLLYAPLLVLTMQVLSLGAVECRFTVVIRSGLPGAAAALAVTMLVFLCLPRDFHRRGLLGDRLDLRTPDTLLSMDFTEEVDLDRRGKVLAGDRVVMRVLVEHGQPAEVSPLWRGATLDRYDDGQWLHTAFPKNWLPPVARSGRPPVDWVRVRVSIHDLRHGRLFVPNTSRGLRPLPPARSNRVVPLADGTYLYPRGSGGFRKIEYRLYLDPSVSTPQRPRNLTTFLWLSPDVRRGPAARLARTIRAELPADATNLEIAEAMSRHLSMHYYYLPPGAEGGARSLEDFLQDGRGGHCEVFATALAVMLRCEEVPSRLVTGFRSQEWDEEGTTLTIRARHSHSWVEALDPDRGWVAVDPSPASAFDDEDDGDGIFAQLAAAAREFWETITNFDTEARDRALAWIEAAPGRFFDAARRDPLPFGVLATAFAALVAVRVRQRRRREPAEIVAYRRCVRKVGIVRRPEETPRELLDRARTRVLHPKRVDRLAQATERHEAARYTPTGA